MAVSAHQRRETSAPSPQAESGFCYLPARPDTRRRQPVRGRDIASFVPGIAALIFTLIALMLPMLHARAADAATPATVGQRQVISIGADAPYSFITFAIADLQKPQTGITRAVVILHGVKRNAIDYFGLGQHLLQLAQLPPSATLLLAPNFLTPQDANLVADMPLWRRDDWMQGQASDQGRAGITSFRALDDLVHYLADRRRFPALKEIVLIGHSAGAQLMQRHAVMNDLDASLQQAGVTLRYIISSPSSYVYFEASRPSGESFIAQASATCPAYNDYRYGIANPPAYLADQHLSGQQLFQRYAARHITYLVGARDDNPRHRFLDRSCGAAMQGATRVERQQNFMRYERFLSAKWNIPVDHPEFEVPGATHDANRVYGSEAIARKLFPQ
ncbi:hypothetical protein PQR62_17605 [Herbaspirillum lusitanum]|uniref:Alpha/beta hydrolase n=1 Tax=Herbaspirillum lusitanum TaxID=213312 RepID=A0ABW9AB36_9BURK